MGQTEVDVDAVCVDGATGPGRRDTVTSATSGCLLLVKRLYVFECRLQLA